MGHLTKAALPGKRCCRLLIGRLKHVLTAAVRDALGDEALQYRTFFPSFH
jgi:hypothetical protein